MAAELVPADDPTQRRLIMLARGASFLFQQAQQQARRSREPRMAALSLALGAMARLNVGPGMLEPMITASSPVKLRHWMRCLTRTLLAAQDSALPDEAFMALVAELAAEFSADGEARDGRAPEA